jgi:hypothetical protein
MRNLLLLQRIDPPRRQFLPGRPVPGCVLTNPRYLLKFGPLVLNYVGIGADV